MKYIIIFLIASNSLLGQFHCDSIIETKIDKFTKHKQYLMKESIICLDDNKKGFVILPKLIDDDIMIYFAIVPKKCVDDVKVYFLMDNDNLIKATNRYKFNCDGLLGIQIGYYGMSDDNAKEFYVRKIKSIRIELDDKFIDFDLTEEQSTLLMETLNCLQYRKKK